MGHRVIGSSVTEVRVVGEVASANGLLLPFEPKVSRVPVPRQASQYAFKVTLVSFFWATVLFRPNHNSRSAIQSASILPVQNCSDSPLNLAISGYQDPGNFGRHLGGWDEAEFLQVVNNVRGSGGFQRICLCAARRSRHGWGSASRSRAWICRSPVGGRQRE